MIDLPTLISFFQSFGYGAVFVVLLLCGFGVPIPEDIALIAGGIISGLGYTNLYVMIFVGLAGVLVGDSIIFNLGRKLGKGLLEKRFFKSIITEKRFNGIKTWFQKYGRVLLFAARFMPGLRAPIFATAGITRIISFRSFLLIDGSAALISVPVWIYLGYYGAHNREKLLEWVTQSHIVLVSLAAAIGVFFLLKMLIHRRFLKH